MAKTFGEVGDSGLVRWSGMVESRFIKDLYGHDGITVFEEMFRRDPSLRSFLYATKVMARKSTWEAVGASDQGVDVEAKDFLASCLEDMSHTMTDFVDNVLSMLPHGWSWAEICYKRRLGPNPPKAWTWNGAKQKYEMKPLPASLFDDGKIGIRKFAPRKQTSWYKWEFDETGGVKGLWQWPQGSRRAGRAVLIPIEKSLHFKTEPAQGDPEGISVGEGCYEHWYVLKNLLPLMGMGFERSFVGLPVFPYREGVIPDASDKAAVEAMGKGLTMGSKAFAAIPAIIDGFRLDSVANPIAGDILNTIKYFRILMLQSVLAEFVAIGTGGPQSLAAHQDMTSIYLMAINGILDIIEAVLNRFAVPRLFQYNEFPSMTALPTLQHSEVLKTDLGVLGAFIQAIAGFIPLQDEDVIWVRKQAGMPIIEEAQEEAPEPETGGEEEAVEAEEGELAEFTVKEPFTPKGAGKPLLPVPAEVTISDADVDRAVAYWDEAMPTYKGMLEAELTALDIEEMPY